jgi:membrane protease YdiL (CAAX protease family)
MASSSRTFTRPAAASTLSRPRWWTWLATVELALATAAVLLDLLLPSLVLVLLAGISLAVRRQSPATLGIRRAHAPGLVSKMFVVAAGWSVVQLSLTMPLATHLSGRKQNLSQFDDVQGNPVLLLAFVALSWTLAAFVEELAFRGFLLTRLREILGPSKIALVVAVLLTSVLFGVMHSEQGMVGVLLVGLDAIVLSIVCIHYDTLWASVLVHGFSNTLGFVTFFFVGPVYGLW